MTHVYTIPARKKTEGERGGAAGGRAATPLRQREESYFERKSLNIFSAALSNLNMSFTEHSFRIVVHCAGYYQDEPLD
jgi:hypothetical protein